MKSAKSFSSSEDYFDDDDDGFTNEVQNLVDELDSQTANSAVNHSKNSCAVPLPAEASKVNDIDEFDDDYDDDVWKAVEENATQDTSAVVGSTNQVGHY